MMAPQPDNAAFSSHFSWSTRDSTWPQEEAYGGDVCSGYMASYEGDAWSWGGQSWGGYPHCQYDASSWEYQQPQQQQSWGANPGPKYGAEILTDLRLAELKRLIDRDAADIKRAEESRDGDLVFDEAGEKAGDTGQPATGAEEAGPTITLQSSAKLADTPLHGHVQVDDVSDVASTQDRPASSEQEPKPPGKGKAPSSSSEAEVVARVEAMVPQATPPASPRGPPESCREVLADFLPESRCYGELPVREGDLIFISSDPVDGWIFGQRRGNDPDEGWLPAAALGLGDAGELQAEEVQEQQPQRQRRGRGRATAAGAAARRNGAAQQQPQEQQQKQHPQGPAQKQHPQQQRKADYSRNEPQQASDRASGGPLEQQPWHHHGNWWSRQRHLKPQEEARRQPWGGTRQSGSGTGGGGTGASQGGAAAGTTRHGSGGGGGGGGGASRAAAAAESEEELEAPVAHAGRGRGGGGRGRGGRTRPMERVQPRERPALSSLLDRLQKPLVAPKPVER